LTSERATSDDEMANIRERLKKTDLLYERRRGAISKGDGSGMKR
jgi:hypothetical protein